MKVIMPEIARRGVALLTIVALQMVGNPDSTIAIPLSQYRVSEIISRSRLSCQRRERKHSLLLAFIV